MNFDYLTSYWPPAPGLQIVLRSDEQATLPVPALLDTGADVCIVPSHYVLTLKAPKEDFGILRSQWGEPREVAIHSLDFQIGQSLFARIDVVSDERSDEIVLGRNLLNRMNITLRGPNQTLEFHE